MELSRTVRFCVGDEPGSATEPAFNTFAGHPPMRGLGRFYELTIRCRGEVDAQTGYFVNIKEIDRAVRESVVPRFLAAAAVRSAEVGPARLLIEVFTPLDRALGGVVRAAQWWLSPFVSLEVESSAMDTVLMREVFEFAAAHRLHCPSLSEVENQRIFGKCNNPRGHGHNYKVEPCVEVPVLGPDRPTFSLADLERLTHGVLIERFDHKHLNEDCPEFRAGGGLNPSVENIAKVCFDLLAPAVAGAAPGGGARLRSVTVWETDKTSCTYPG